MHSEVKILTMEVQLFYADNGASLLISNSQIINNHKNMVIRDNNVGDLVDGVVVATGYTKISKSYFRNNSGCYGGAVTSLGYTNAGKNQIIIENSVFDANRAFQGAAVNVIGSTFKISEPISPTIKVLVMEVEILM